MTNAVVMPPPQEIKAQIDACRAEMAALKRLLRLSQAAQEAEQARMRRRRNHNLDGGVHR